MIFHFNSRLYWKWSVIQHNFLIVVNRALEECFFLVSPFEKYQHNFMYLNTYVFSTCWSHIFFSADSFFFVFGVFNSIWSYRPKTNYYVSRNTLKGISMTVQNYQWQKNKQNTNRQRKYKALTRISGKNQMTVVFPRTGFNFC